MKNENTKNEYKKEKFNLENLKTIKKSVKIELHSYPENSAEHKTISFRLNYLTKEILLIKQLFENKLVSWAN